MASPEEEDFTFTFTFPATITHPPKRFIESPLLWWRRSFSPPSGHKPSKSYKDKKVVQGEDKKFNLCSVEDLKGSTFSHTKSSDGDEKEEKMDMLWENMNEEYSTRKGYIPSPGRGANAKALKLSKTNGNLVSGQKTMILVFMSVLKNAFASPSRNERGNFEK